jgi:hypothetical protein
MPPQPALFTFILLEQSSLQLPWNVTVHSEGGTFGEGDADSIDGTIHLFI